MTRIDNLRDSQAVRDRKNTEALAKAAPLESTSVQNGRTRFIGGDLVGEAGAQQTWHGDVLLDGDVRITLSLQVNGNTQIDGSTVIGGDVWITEDLDVSATTMLRGLTTLLNDLRVESGGKITINGPIPFELRNGALLFANGTEISGGSFGIRMAGPGSTITAGSSIAGMAAGGNYVTVDGSSVQTGGHFRADGTSQFVEEAIFQGPVTMQDAIVYMPGLPTKTGTGALPGTLWIDPIDSDGRVYVAG